jgi:hypothetical protein
MKESAVVAYSFVKGLMAKDFPENRFFEHARLHLHCPEGAVPKDGKPHAHAVTLHISNRPQLLLREKNEANANAISQDRPPALQWQHRSFLWL